MDTFVNKVAESGLITLNLEEFLPAHVMEFDLKEFLFMGLILKEKDYRAALQAHDWSVYEGKDVIIHCSADAIIPVWAYMLAATYLQPVASSVQSGKLDDVKMALAIQAIQSLDVSSYEGQRVVIKGCGDVHIPESMYTAITAKLRPHVKSIMYGEPCSTVPVYKKKTTAL